MDARESFRRKQRLEGSAGCSFAQLVPLQLVVIEDAGFLARFVVVVVVDVAWPLLRKKDRVEVVDLLEVVWHFVGFARVVGTLPEKFDLEFEKALVQVELSWKGKVPLGLLDVWPQRQNL